MGVLICCLGILSSAQICSYRPCAAAAAVPANFHILAPRPPLHSTTAFTDKDKYPIIAVLLIKKWNTVSNARPTWQDVAATTNA